MSFSIPHFIEPEEDPDGEVKIPDNMTIEQVLTIFRPIMWEEFTGCLLRVQARCIMQGLDRGTIAFVLGNAVPEASDAFISQLRPRLMMGNRLEALIPDSEGRYAAIFQQLKHDEWAERAVTEAFNPDADEERGG